MSQLSAPTVFVGAPGHNVDAAIDVWNQNKFAGERGTAIMAAPVRPTLATHGVVGYVKGHMWPILAIAVGLYLLEHRRRGSHPFGGKR